MNIPDQRIYYVIFVTTAYESFDDVQTKAPDLVAAHIARSQELSAQGKLFMAGAFLDNPNEPLSMMAVLTSPEAAEEYIKGDPAYLKGMVRSWHVREWANMFS
ncbi:MAG TPA: YciI family protein [Ktedonobacterales bacterium]|jgi:uncharacterized protein YciI